MVLYNIYSDDLRRTYRAHICSFATIFNICVGALTFISPLFLAYHSIGFWMREDNFREQPEVNYKHHFILLVHGRDTNPIILGYSTYLRLNNLFGESLRIPTISSAEVDANHDGKNDFLNLQIMFPLSETEYVHHVQLLLFFDYQLHKFPTVQMQSMANIYYSSPLPGVEFLIEGYLKLNQRHPLPHKGLFTKFNNTIIDVGSDNLKSWDLNSIVSSYQARNITTDFIGRYPIWKTGYTYGNPFLIKVKIHYPEETVIYRPGFWQVMKFAWIQYLAILIVFIKIFGSLKRFVYNNRIVPVVKQKTHLD